MSRPLAGAAGRHVVLVSGHHLASERRAGFHHLAFAYRRLGWRVTFVTVGMSPLSYLRPDHRRRSFRLRDRNRRVELSDGMTSYVWFTPWHPSDTRTSWGNALTMPLFRRFGRLRFRDLPSLMAGASLVIIESTYSLFLANRLRAMVPDARLVYRQSDDLDALRAHPALHEAESRALDAFDLVSVPEARRLERFGNRPQARVHHHGVEKGLFDDPGPSPYRALGFDVNAVFVGVDGLDEASLRCGAARLPRWGFHLVGPWEASGLPGNVVVHGEMPFAATAPFVTHADVGLHTIVRPRADLFRESLKVLQYTYCRLPIVAEESAAAPWPHVFSYSHARPESIVGACLTAHAFPREQVPREDIRSWEGLALDLAGTSG